MITSGTLKKGHYPAKMVKGYPLEINVSLYLTKEALFGQSGLCLSWIGLVSLVKTLTSSTFVAG